MQIKLTSLFILYFLATGNSLANTTLSTIIGARNLNASQDVLTAIGFNLTTDKYHPNFSPELTLNFAFGLLGGEEQDYGVGLAYISHRDTSKIIVGAGVSYFSSEYGANVSDGSLLYVHCGGITNITTTLKLGLDLRISEEIDSNSNFEDEDIGYVQYGILFEKIW